MFTQLLDPLNNLTLTCLVALIPVVLLLVLLAVFRWPAWLALKGSEVTRVEVQELLTKMQVVDL